MSSKSTRLEVPGAVAATHTRTWSRVRALTSLGMVLVLVLLLVSQAGAQGEEVRVTFKLQVDGDVPAGTVFVVSHDFLPERGGSSPLPYFFCGSDAPPPALTGPATCEGGGTEYTYSRKLQRGHTIEYEFARLGADPADTEAILRDTDTLNSDKTYSAHYTFPGIRDTKGDGQGQHDMPSQLPDAGAGGMNTNVAQSHSR